MTEPMTAERFIELLPAEPRKSKFNRDEDGRPLIYKPTEQQVEVLFRRLRFHFENTEQVRDALASDEFQALIATAQQEHFATAIAPLKRWASSQPILLSDYGTAYAAAKRDALDLLWAVGA